MSMPPPAEPRRSFDGVAEIYHGIRPGYPPPMFDELFRPRVPALSEMTLLRIVLPPSADRYSPM